MIQRPVLAGSNGGDEFFLQQNDSNSQFENSNKRSRNPDNNVNRGTSYLFYKTRMCQKFLEGTCRNAQSCTFAHGTKDLHDPSPNWQEIVKENRGGGGGGNGNWNWNDDQKIIHRMRICRKFYHGDECPYGENCNFLHENPAKFKGEAAMDTGRTRESSVINIQTVVDRDQAEGGQTLRGNVDALHVGTVSTDPDALRASVKGTYWKTRICSKWDTTGQCIFADKCHFAHGLAELHTALGRMEGERHHYAVSCVAANVVQCPMTEAPPPPATAAVPVSQGDWKGFGKWKLAKKKLNRIYGDWIDDEKEESIVGD